MAYSVFTTFFAHGGGGRGVDAGDVVPYFEFEIDGSKLGFEKPEVRISVPIMWRPDMTLGDLEETARRQAVAILRAVAEKLDGTTVELLRDETAAAVEALSPSDSD